MESKPDHENGAEWESQLLRAGLSATWLVTEHNLIQLVVEGEYTFVAPSGTDIAGTLDGGGALICAYSWEVFRLGGGITRKSTITEKLEITTVIAPTLDLWWRW